MKTHVGMTNIYRNDMSDDRNKMTAQEKRKEVAYRRHTVWGRKSKKWTVTREEKENERTLRARARDRSRQQPTSSSEKRSGRFNLGAITGSDNGVFGQRIGKWGNSAAFTHLLSSKGWRAVRLEQTAKFSLLRLLMMRGLLSKHS